MILIDVDNFKQINDTCGHKTGDAVLQMVGGCLKRHLRSYDVVARFGGDEFSAVCTDCDWDSVGSPIMRLRDGLKHLSIPAEMGRRGVTLSIGAAVIRRGYGRFTASDLVSAADEALYEAKRAGRDRAYRVELSAASAAAEPFGSSSKIAVST